MAFSSGPLGGAVVPLPWLCQRLLLAWWRGQPTSGPGSEETNVKLLTWGSLFWTWVWAPECRTLRPQEDEPKGQRPRQAFVVPGDLQLEALSRCLPPQHGGGVFFSFCLPGVSNLLASLGHTGRRRVVLGHPLNTQTLMKTGVQKEGFK